MKQLRSGRPSVHKLEAHPVWSTKYRYQVLAGGETLVATTGSFVWIPRGTVHAFKVDSLTATLLNSYIPAGFEQVIIHAGLPATAFELPKPGLGMNMSPPVLMKLFGKIGMHVVGATLQPPVRLPSLARQHPAAGLSAPGEPAGYRSEVLEFKASVGWPRHIRRRASGPAAAAAPTLPRGPAR